MPSATITTPQPQLKKKTSFRDRLKAWQKPPQPLQVVAEESKPRFAYKPTHAAADFSRLAVSPLSPPRHQFPPDHRRSRQGDDGWEEGKEGSRRRRSRSGTNHHPCVALDETFQAANATAHVPVPTQPVALDANAETQRNRGAAPSQPLSDYELFIARAEAEDREWRGHILRNISHRSAAYTADRVKPDPHRQFAAAGASSAGRSPEVNSDKLPPHKDNNIQEHAMGSGNASTQSPPRWELRQSGSRGHARQPSWARSSTSTNITAAEKSPDKKKSSRSSNQALVQQQQQQQARPSESSRPTVYGAGVGPNPSREHQAASSPRTLRRQTSITQRIAKYIRPPKPVERGVETLVE
ncbi:hypothetical protein C7999DRAFT_42641 [Corynascus novoguineensis]|uniref:Uncharacterized protein n=1 Tax=Corynascus novoguineensis TaxID=1126955 RepID=A0AAN7CS70_9PEZI|nr:hypothetical protein C7999DRAFT_42641 [Corynascus novoguineensis]